MRNIYDDEKEKNIRISSFEHNRTQILDSILETEEKLYELQRMNYEKAEADSESYETLFHQRMSEILANPESYDS